MMNQEAIKEKFVHGSKYNDTQNDVLEEMLFGHKIIEASSTDNAAQFILDSGDELFISLNYVSYFENQSVSSVSTVDFEIYDVPVDTDNRGNVTIHAVAEDGQWVTLLVVDGGLDWAEERSFDDWTDPDDYAMGFLFSLS